MRLIRTILILTGAGLLMPSPPDNYAASGGGPVPLQVSASEMLSSATSAFSDLGEFCVRQPSACETAAVVAAHFEAKAKYSAKLIYEWATDPGGIPETPSVPVQADASDQLETSSTKTVVADSVPAAGQSTLRLDDLIPEWRGPPASKKKG